MVEKRSLERWNVPKKTLLCPSDVRSTVIELLKKGLSDAEVTAKTGVPGNWVRFYAKQLTPEEDHKRRGRKRKEPTRIDSKVTPCTVTRMTLQDAVNYKVRLPWNGKVTLFEEELTPDILEAVVASCGTLEMLNKELTLYGKNNNLGSKDDLRSAAGGPPKQKATRNRTRSV